MPWCGGFRSVSIFSTLTEPWEEVEGGKRKRPAWGLPLVYWLAGAGLIGSGALINAVSLDFAPLSLLEAFGSVQFVSNLLYFPSRISAQLFSCSRSQKIETILSPQLLAALSTCCKLRHSFEDAVINIHPAPCKLLHLVPPGESAAATRPRDSTHGLWQHADRGVG